MSARNWTSGCTARHSGQRKRAKSPRLDALDAPARPGSRANCRPPTDAKNWIALEWMQFLNDIDNKADAAQV
jgi:leukotriene-A4 hydrolase